MLGGEKTLTKKLLAMYNKIKKQHPVKRKG
jgi:hypothetical protein